MRHANDAKRLALAVIGALSMIACSAEDANTTAADTADRITKEEVTRYLDWAVELRNQMIAAMAEARQTLDDNEAYVAMFERRRREQEEILAREPFKGTLKGRAINGVIDTLYASGAYVRNEEEIRKLQSVHGTKLVDSILAHEALIREKLDPDGLGVWKRALVQ